MTNETFPTVILHNLEPEAPLSECLDTFSGFALLARGEEPYRSNPVLGFPTMWMKGWIDECNTNVLPPPDLGCTFTSNASVYGCGHILSDGALIVENIGLADVARDWHGGTRASLAERDVVHVAEPAISFVGPGNRVYGHWLMDFLPRLYIATRLLGERFFDFSLLIPSDTPDYVIRLCLTFFGRRLKFRYYDPDRNLLLCEKLCIPTYPFSRGHDYHPLVKDLFEPYRPKVTGSRKFCVSRKKMEHQSAGIAKSFPEWRVFESIAELHGYEVIYPEQHQLHDQISMFATARVIVGEFGSALHNSVFCGPGTLIGATGFFGDAQLKLCSLSDQVCAYVPHEAHEYINGVLHYSCSTISIAEFFRSIDEHLKEEIK